MATMIAAAARALIDPPPPGVYKGVPAETYHSWFAASKSILGEMHQRTPAHAWAALTTPRDPTPALVRGDALHAAVLEPHVFAERYTVAEQCGETLASGANKGSRCTSDGKVYRGGVWRCGTHDKGESEETRRVLSREDYAICQGMVAQVRANPDAADLLDSCDERELSIVFYWPGTKILCKARPDVPAFEARTLGDIKTTGDASEREFTRSIKKYRYHQQAAFYETGCAELDHPIDDTLFVPVESTPPHGSKVYRMRPEAKAQGLRELQRLLPIWQQCRESGVWPGYAPGITDISLPAYGWD